MKQIERNERDNTECFREISRTSTASIRNHMSIKAMRCYLISVHNSVVYDQVSRYSIIKHLKKLNKENTNSCYWMCR